MRESSSELASAGLRENVVDIKMKNRINLRIFLENIYSMVNQRHLEFNFGA